MIISKEEGKIIWMISELNVFLSVCKNMSISRWTEEMFISQHAMSKQIQGLEKEMGVKLINHNGRKIELSDAGVYVP